MHFLIQISGKGVSKRSTGYCGFIPNYPFKTNPSVVWKNNKKTAIMDFLSCLEKQCVGLFFSNVNIIKSDRKDT